MTRHWMTFTAGHDKFKEVMAVQIASELNASHTNGRAEAPSLGIVIENDARALILAIGAVTREVARRYAHLNLRMGAMTIASESETRTLLTDGDNPVFGRDTYEKLWNNPRRRAQDLALLTDIISLETA